MDRILKMHVAVGVISIIFITGCHQTANNSSRSTPSKIPVTASQIHTGRMASYVELTATSAFLLKASVKAPVTGYIEKMLINQGDAVDKNRLLFTIKTKEASAIINDSINSFKFSGNVNVSTGVSGIISIVGHTVGDYVAEGDELCQIAVPESFAFILDIPFELTRYLRLNTFCEINLPDGRSVRGIIKSRFPSMSGSSQTERFIVRLTELSGLPENLIAKIRIVKESIENAKYLPKSCILTNETMESFWVMKLINDSSAVKVNVTTGISEKENVQIKMPVFRDSDLFLSSGNYGLGDTANVRVIKTTGNE